MYSEIWNYMDFYVRRSCHLCVGQAGATHRTSTHDIARAGEGPKSNYIAPQLRSIQTSAQSDSINDTNTLKAGNLQIKDVKNDAGAGVQMRPCACRRSRTDPGGRHKELDFEGTALSALSYYYGVTRKTPLTKRRLLGIMPLF